MKDQNKKDFVFSGAAIPIAEPLKTAKPLTHHCLHVTRHSQHTTPTPFQKAFIACIFEP